MEFCSLSKRFGNQEVLKDFSLSLPEKGRFCLFGPSGCGKTTLLRLAAGLEKAESGRLAGVAREKNIFCFSRTPALPLDDSGRKHFCGTAAGPY